jgi:hypothetical protein
MHLATQLVHEHSWSSPQNALGYTAHQPCHESHTVKHAVQHTTDPKPFLAWKLT